MYVLVFMLLLVLSTGGFVFLHSPGFYATSIEVRGNERVAAEEIVARSGLHEGVHLLMALDEAVRRAILELAWLERVTLRPVYPGRIVIAVTERQPAAVLATAAGFFIVDKQGFLLERLARPDAGLVVVTGVPEQGWATRSRPPGRELVVALEVVAGLAAAGLDQVQEVGVTQSGDINLFLGGGTHVLLGQPGAGVGHALQLLRALLDELGSELGQVGYIDLRFERPVIKKR
jgi:cell division protein FtsQ